LRVGGENIRVRKRKRSYQFHQRWGAKSTLFYARPTLQLPNVLKTTIRILGPSPRSRA
jgi:hypothetical protein